jgi:hypothetical protein
MGPLLSSDYDRSKYLRAEDLKQEKKFRIKAVTEEVFEKDKVEKKPVLWFTNDERGLVLNKTNNRTLRGAFGDPFADWINKVIAVFPTTEPFRGKMVPCLRVRIPPPKQATVALQQPVTSRNGAAAVPAAAPIAAAVPAAAPIAAVGPAAAPVLAAAPLAAAATATTALAAVDPELDPDPVKPLRDELDDEVPW